MKFFNNYKLIIIKKWKVMKILFNYCKINYKNKNKLLIEVAKIQ